MCKSILCKLPLSLKIGLGNLRTFFNQNKKKAIKKLHDYSDDEYFNINTNEYRKNLTKFLWSCAFNAKETQEYIGWLYNDSIRLIHVGDMDVKLPTIICVVKNEEKKIVNFFDHYSKIGNFNYIFIDNGSEDNSVELLKHHNATIYQCLEPFSTNRKIAWINKIYSTLQREQWTILLDADELLVYNDYENISINSLFDRFEQNNITTVAAVMVDMFSLKPIVNDDYIEQYIYFENTFHEERSFYFNSIYGGIRERVFKEGNNRIFLIKKHPVVKKTEESMLIHCHYVYPYKRNFESKIYFAMLHYKLFDKEISKYRKIAEEESYGNNSIEYKTYVNRFKEKTYEEIFKVSGDTVCYEGTSSLKKIECLCDVGEL